MKWHELKKQIGDKWKHATVCIQDGGCNIRPAVRVSLHENDNGGLLVVLHDVQLANGGLPPKEESTEK